MLTVHGYTVVESIAKALYIHSYYGTARPWEKLEEGARDSWRDLAFRLIYEIGPKCGIDLATALKAGE